MSFAPAGREGPARWPRRVLMTTDAVGGVFTYTVELARALGAHGVDVTVALLGTPTAAQRSRLAAIPHVNVEAADFRLEWMDDPWDDVARSGAWLQELAARHMADFVHLNGYAHGALRWEVPVLVVGHSCVLTWWEAVHRQPAPAAWARYRHEVRRGLAGADLAVTPTQAMLRGLRRHYGPLPRTEVIGNGRTLWPARGTEKEPVILAAGRLWDEAKNLAALDRIAPFLAWPVYVAGDVVHPGGRLAAMRHVQPLGLLPAGGLRGWYRRASIYALPARYEPFGLSVLEAAQAGCALVLGDVDSLREVWGDAALYVDPFSDVALAEALSRLIEDPGLRLHLAQAAQARSRAHVFSPSAMAVAYLQAYGTAAAARA